MVKNMLDQNPTEAEQKAREVAILLLDRKEWFQDDPVRRDDARLAIERELLAMYDQGLEHAAGIADNHGHLWSGNTANALFNVAEAIRAAKTGGGGK